MVRLPVILALVLASAMVQASQSSGLTTVFFFPAPLTLAQRPNMQRPPPNAAAPASQALSVAARQELARCRAEIQENNERIARVIWQTKLGQQKPLDPAKDDYAKWLQERQRQEEAKAEDPDSETNWGAEARDDFKKWKAGQQAQPEEMKTPQKFDWEKFFETGKYKPKLPASKNASQDDE